MKINPDLCDGAWRHEGDYFTIGNKIPRGGDIFFWQEFVSLKTFKKKTEYSDHIASVNFVDYRKNYTATLKHNQAKFFKEFYDKLPPSKENYLQKNKLLIGGEKEFEDKTVLLTHCPIKKYITGLAFIDKTGIVHKIECEDEKAGLFIKGNKRIFFASSIEDGVIAHKSTGASVFVALCKKGL